MTPAYMQALEKLVSEMRGFMVEKEKGETPADEAKESPVEQSLENALGTESHETGPYDVAHGKSDQAMVPSAGHGDQKGEDSIRIRIMGNTMVPGKKG